MLTNQVTMIYQQMQIQIIYLLLKVLIVTDTSYIRATKITLFLQTLIMKSQFGLKQILLITKKMMKKVNMEQVSLFQTQVVHLTDLKELIQTMNGKNILFM